MVAGTGDGGALGEPDTEEAPSGEPECWGLRAATSRPRTWPRAWRPREATGVMPWNEACGLAGSGFWLPTDRGWPSVWGAWSVPGSPRVAATSYLGCQLATVEAGWDACLAQMRLDRKTGLGQGRRGGEGVGWARDPREGLGSVQLRSGPGAPSNAPTADPSALRLPGHQAGLRWTGPQTKVPAWEDSERGSLGPGGQAKGRGPAVCQAPAAHTFSNQALGLRPLPSPASHSATPRALCRLGHPQVALGVASQALLVLAWGQFPEERGATLPTHPQERPGPARAGGTGSCGRHSRGSHYGSEGPEAHGHRPRGARVGFLGGKASAGPRGAAGVCGGTRTGPAVPCPSIARAFHQHPSCQPGAAYATGPPQGNGAGGHQLPRVSEANN